MIFFALDRIVGSFGLGLGDYNQPTDLEMKVNVR